MQKIFMRTPFNYDTNDASDESGLSCKDPSLAQQQYAEESDINFIAERYGLTGEMPQVLQLPSYGDFTGIYDFQTAHNAIIEANRQFMTLPAKLRARFDNQPQKLLEFLDDEDNRKEAEFLGLIQPAEEAPQSPQGDAGAKEAPGDTLSPEKAPEAPAKPAKKAGKTDT